MCFQTFGQPLPSLADVTTAAGIDQLQKSKRDRLAGCDNLGMGTWSGLICWDHDLQMPLLVWAAPWLPFLLEFTMEMQNDTALSDLDLWGLIIFYQDWWPCSPLAHASYHPSLLLVKHHRTRR